LRRLASRERIYLPKPEGKARPRSKSTTARCSLLTQLWNQRPAWLAQAQLDAAVAEAF